MEKNKTPLFDDRQFAYHKPLSEKGNMALNKAMEEIDKMPPLKSDASSKEIAYIDLPKTLKRMGYEKK